MQISCKDKIEPITIKNDHKKYYDAVANAAKFANKNRLDSAFYFYNQARNLVTKDSTNNKIIYALMLMSEIQQIQSDYIGSERSATEALAYININTDKSYISSFYNILGNNYDNTFDFELAKKNYNLAIENAINDIEKIMFQNNIAVVLIDDSEFDQALVMLKTLKENPKTETNKVIYAKILDNIGYCLLKPKLRIRKKLLFLT